MHITLPHWGMSLWKCFVFSFGRSVDCHTEKNISINSNNKNIL